MKRTKSWDEMVSDNLKKGPKSVAAYLTGLLEADEELSLEEALRLTISAMGEKEFCQMAGATQANVNAFINKKRKLGADALNNLLRPFGLKAELVLKKAS
jgi:antitoxin component HigA of HigAB toxin-antitoxin module